MSVKGHTHKEIETFLMQEVEALQWFDKDKGQFENISNHVMPLPAVLMSFGRTPYEDLQNNIQKGQVTLRFRIGYENYADSFSGSINQDKALEFFEFNESIYKTLQGLSITYVKNLTRIADEDDDDHKNLIVTIMEFTGTLIDDSAEACKNFILVEPDPVLDVKHVSEIGRPAREGNSYIIPN